GGGGLGDFQARHRSRKHNLYTLRVNATYYLANLFAILKEHNNWQPLNTQLLICTPHFSQIQPKAAKV
ncbi:MAG: hypothetical protein ACJ788_07030, partial [Ktedonobacteraceae bacterium]